MLTESIKGGQGETSFFRSRQVNFAVFIDIEESFVWVDRGEYNMTENPPDRPKKLVFWQAYSE